MTDRYFGPNTSKFENLAGGSKARDLMVANAQKAEISQRTQEIFPQPIDEARVIDLSAVRARKKLSILMGLAGVGTAFAIACGGGAKANYDNSVQIPTQPAATEVPKLPTPEPSLEEKLWMSTEVKDMSEVKKSSDAMLQILATKLPANDVDLVNVGRDLTQVFAPYDENTENGIGNHVSAISRVVQIVSKQYCDSRFGRPTEMLALIVYLRNDTMSRVDGWIKKGIAAPNFKNSIQNKIFASPACLNVSPPVSFRSDQ